MTWRVNEAHHPQKFTVSTTISTFGLSAVAHRRRTAWTFVKCGISIADFNCNAPPKLLTMSTGPDSSDSFNKCRLAMVNVPRSTDVNTWLISIFFDIPFWQGLFPVQQLVS